MRVFIATHKADIDGISPYIFLRLMYPEHSIEYRFLDANEINGFLEENLASNYFKNFDKVYITDLTVSKKNCESINKDVKLREKLKIFDHHIFDLSNADYGFGFSKDVDENGVKQCATSLFYDHLLSERPDIFDKPVFKDYVENVRQYDVWEWEKTNNQDAKRLTMLFDILGRSVYIDKYIEYFKTHDTFSFTESEMYLLKSEQDRINQYIKECEKRIIPCTICGKSCAVLFADRHRSEVGNALAKTFEGKYDVIVLVNMNMGVSYRTISDNIDLSQIAATFCGGGHKKASGSPIAQSFKEKVVLELFSKGNIRLD